MACLSRSRRTLGVAGKLETAVLDWPDAVMRFVLGHPPEYTRTTYLDLYFIYIFIPGWSGR